MLMEVSCQSWKLLGAKEDGVPIHCREPRSTHMAREETLALIPEQ